MKFARTVVALGLVIGGSITSWSTTETYKYGARSYWGDLLYDADQTSGAGSGTVVSGLEGHFWTAVSMQTTCEILVATTAWISTLHPGDTQCDLYAAVNHGSAGSPYADATRYGTTPSETFILTTNTDSGFTNVWLGGGISHRWSGAIVGTAGAAVTTSFWGPGYSMFSTTEGVISIASDYHDIMACTSW